MLYIFQNARRYFLKAISKIGLSHLARTFFPGDSKENRSCRLSAEQLFERGNKIINADDGLQYPL
jgi:hypothetical protein